MNEHSETLDEKLRNLRNCETLKKQFAYELFIRRGRQGAQHEKTFEVAEMIARRIYPHDVSPNAALYIAGEWVKDHVVIETILQLENCVAEGEFLPNKNQLVMALVNILDQIDEDSKRISKRSKDYKQLGSLRRACVDAGRTLFDVMGWNFEEHPHAKQ